MDKSVNTYDLFTSIQPGLGVLRPVEIPATQLKRYISFKHALNLRFPNEDTGEWHFQSAFFDKPDSAPRDRPIPLAGIGEVVDTTPSLGTKGIRDMASILLQSQIPIPADHPVFVANHFRAIADLVILDIQQGHSPTIATNKAINSWLDTEVQIEHVKIEYLKPLVVQLSGQTLEVFEKWILTVNFD
jgi:hypothetical protein